MKPSATFARCLVVAGAWATLGCSEQQVVAELRSLSGSGDAVFLCRDGNGDGHPLSDCPDHDGTDDTDPARRLSMLALVSQTLTDEVALVDLSQGHVVDVDPKTPGYGFLRVGGRPISMTATPGSRATFVATSEPGRHGIFALPTTLLQAPEAGHPQLDLTTWAACRLPERPGEMAVVVATSGDCNTPYADGQELGLEKDAGRRKLVVSLPDSGKLAVIDAQDLLDRPHGTFEPCDFTEVALQVDVPAGVAQKLPDDLVTTCDETPAPSAPTPDRTAPRPAGFAMSEDRLYVADEAAPVIHVLDTSSVCDLKELPALLPMSLREPTRVVTTKRLAVSPLTPSGQRFVYAIDAEDQPGASVMVFDVSPGAVDRTPLVRPGSPELPAEKPDRLALTASAKDVAFAYRDIPYVDTATGVGEFGKQCDPWPDSLATSDPLRPDPLGLLARPNADFSLGARPGLLRGLFGFVLLSNGAIAIADVEDLDAPCRRPVATNASNVQDYRGCSNDSTKVPYFTVDGTEAGTPTVTGEASCRVVEPHRFRSVRLDLNSSLVGVHAPSLRGFPQLTLPASAPSTSSENRPRLLAASFVSPVSATTAQTTEVFVGSTLYTTGAGGEPLPIDPNNHDSDVLQSLNAVVLPPLEPRAYAADDTVSLTYEGSYAGDRPSGIIKTSEDGVLTLEDSSLSFCGAGVYDQATMSDFGSAELGVAAEDAKAFGVLHGDYVQIITDFPGADDTYWAAASKRLQKLGLSRDLCIQQFGAVDADTLQTTRDFRILSAHGDKLELESRTDDVTADVLQACLPNPQKYRLRGGAHWVLGHALTGFRHDIVASGADNKCIRSCSPLHKWDKTRVFEISSDAGHCKVLEMGAVAGDPLEQRVGCATDADVACVFDQTASPGVQPGTPAWNCVYAGLTERFALYRGRQASVRDAAFTWQTTGGFTPLVMSVSSLSTVVAPQTLQYLPQLEDIAVVDGASQGLSLFSLDTFGVVKPSPFY